MWWGIGTFFLIVILCVRLTQYFRFRALLKVERGQSYKALQECKAKPIKITVDNNKFVYIYNYFSFKAALFGGTQIKTIVFTVENDKIVYKNECL